MLPRLLLALSLCSLALPAAVPMNCAAGVPLGDLELKVQSDPKLGMRPLRTINRLGEGDRIFYSPVKLRLRQHGGKVALVVAPVAPSESTTLQVLEPKAADKPQQWNVPFRAGVIALVYGPDGVNAKRVKEFLSKDDELIAQLADYAEKTAQTEALLGALANWNASVSGPNDTMDAALNGFASQYGITGAIDRTQPRDQQMLAMMRAVNPALSSVDPVAPSPAQRMQQSAMFATSVAGIFFGSTVGLAAGGTALFMNLRTMMFPNTEFRSSFAQGSTPPHEAGLDLCGKREAPKPRTKVAYLWAVRIPNAGPPSVKTGPVNYLPQEHKALLPLSTDEAGWKILDRAHDWKLVSGGKKEFPVKAHTLPDRKSIEVDLSGSHAPPGQYQLAAGWDWDSFAVAGDVHVSPLSNFEKARLTPESQDRLREEDRKTVVQAQGADFQFVEKVAVVKTGDKYNPPVNVPFSLPKGKQQGTQDRLEFELDTKPLSAGDYSLLLIQTDGQPHAAPFKVLPPGPRIENVPIALNAEEGGQMILLKGEHLDRLAKLETDAGTLQLGPANGGEREVEARWKTGVKPGSSMNLRAYAQNNSQPVVIPDGVKVVPPKPAILDLQLSLPPKSDVTLKDGELPAGGFVSASLRVRHAGPETRVHLRCGTSGSNQLTIRVGEQLPKGSVQSISSDTLFLSFDPGEWQTGCVISAVLDNGAEGASKPHQIGRVVRLPQVESFQLTEERAGANYIGKLVGTDLETIAKVGWTADQGIAVQDLPAPVQGANRKQSLQIALPWPPPSPHAAIFMWFRGETEARPTNIHY